MKNFYLKNSRVGGIYIHIPFCRQACRYCDFYFTVSTQYQDQFTESLIKEFELRSSMQEGVEMQSLYLGGGTPSLLSAANLTHIMEKVRSSYGISEDAELTIECNPDDLDAAKVALYLDLGFNRISIGIQSFHEEDLSLMRRSHSALQAAASVKRAASAGFKNITVDLIYGIPGQTGKDWKENIQRTLELPVNHISAYHLTFESGTVFDHWRKKGTITPLAEEESVKMFRVLREELGAAGFEHYEISNFAREGYRSQHNQLYWSGEAYLGFGPAAHSFDGDSRSWNVSSLKKYMRALEDGKGLSEKEELSGVERYHDYLITSLRTSEGVDPAIIESRFGKNVMDHFTDKSAFFVREGLMVEQKEKLSIEPGSWLLTDHIMRELFLDRG